MRAQELAQRLVVVDRWDASVVLFQELAQGFVLRDLRNRQRSPGGVRGPRDAGAARAADPNVAPVVGDFQLLAAAGTEELHDASLYRARRRGLSGKTKEGGPCGPPSVSFETLRDVSFLARTVRLQLGEILVQGCRGVMAGVVALVQQGERLADAGTRELLQGGFVDALRQGVVVLGAEEVVPVRVLLEPLPELLGRPEMAEHV